MGTTRLAPDRLSLRSAAALLTLAILAFLTYRDILFYSFTATDTFSLIETGRIGSFQDLLRILTEPMMNGTGFVEMARFYRPVSVLSFSLDYALWGMNPFGYHLTDLVLHIGVTLLVFLVLESIFRGRRAIAWIGSLVFTLHPILIESIPAISRRHDVLSAFFFLAAYLLLARSDASRARARALRLASVLAYLLAFLSKEIAVVFPAVVIAHGALLAAPAGGAWRSRLRRGLGASLPYVAVTAGVLVWRVAWLGGVGGSRGGAWTWSERFRPSS